MMLSDWFRLFRVRQWYKNLVAGLAIIFSGNLLVPEAQWLAALAFLALSFASAATYAINDVIDAKHDQVHPEKKMRPVAAGRITNLQAIVGSSIMLGGAAVLAQAINLATLYWVLGLYCLTLLYTLGLRRIPYIDIATLSSNYVLRAVAGATAISVHVSPWLVAGVFLLAILLSAAKRRGDIMLLGAHAGRHKIVLGRYGLKDIDRLVQVAAAAIITVYTLFAFLGEHSDLFWTIPFVFYGVYRYTALVHENSSLARRPEKAFADARLVLCGLAWLAVTLIILY